MKKIKFIFIPLCALALTFSGCASYKAVSLNSLSAEIVHTPSKPQEPVRIAAKVFNLADCKKYLDRDVIAEGYQPIQIYIENASDKSYVFSLDRISLSCSRPEEVAQKVHTSTAGRAAGYGVGALIFLPLAIPAIVDGVKSAQANDALDTDFSAKSANNQLLLPHTHFNKLVFVPLSQYQSSFTVTLIEQDSNTPKTFQVFAN